jgi:futalosine hydrolase
MRILITAATTTEIAPALAWIARYKKQFKQLKITTLITGVGSNATTYALTKALTQHRYALVLQAGIAGSFSIEDLEKVFVIKQDVFADLGVWEDASFKDMFSLALIKPNEKPFKKARLTNPHKNLWQLTKLKAVNAVTVNEISTRPKQIEWYKEHFTPTVESMEGAALHYVCLMEEVPFLQIRSVSNLVGIRNKKKWKIGPAIHNLNTALIDLLQILSTKHETDIRF